MSYTCEITTCQRHLHFKAEVDNSHNVTVSVNQITTNFNKICRLIPFYFISITFYFFHGCIYWVKPHVLHKTKLLCVHTR